jgi:hypothetical protein
MTLRGTIENGRLVLDDGEGLPNGTRVDVRVRSAGSKARSRSKGLDPLAKLASRAVTTGVSDLASEHDHYAYGTPKRASKPRRAASKRKAPTTAAKRSKGRRA